ncbi:MAG: efflux RND transporter periplasmic adaptor subunit [Candidatus Omnitrophica bacterium]|nr:Nickel and cobalt resistance protein CnrB [bacterium]NUN95415.1 efflux RND transporter periplasmic adaptor subunit [Candidatus Omnitrophota bacterium]
MKSLLRALKTALVWLGGLAALVLIVAYLAGVFTEKIQPTDTPEAPRQVVLPMHSEGRVEAVREKVVERIPGTVEAKHEISVSSRILATIEDVLVRSGDSIREGSPLIILDSRDLEARELQAERQLEAAQAQLAESSKEYARVQALYRQNVVPLAQFDRVERAYRVASALVDSAKEALAEARVAQTHARIAAPKDGRVVDRLAEPGDTAIPGQPLLRIYDPSELRLETYVRESLATRLQRGAEIEVVIDALGGSLSGRVEEIVPQAEPGARAFLVKIALPLDDRVYPGMFGRAVIQTGETDSLFVPEKAVQTVGQLSYVTLMSGEPSSARQVVHLGEGKREGQLEVLSGVSAGDRVAVFAD